MKRVLIAFIAMCLICLPVALGQSSDAPYQQAKIVAVEKLPSDTPPAAPTSGGTHDAPLQAGVDHYNLHIQVADTVYTCSYDAREGDDKAWLSGNEGLVRIEDKTMFVKRASGEDARLAIVDSTKANNP